jgi:hypothetical protein
MTLDATHKLDATNINFHSKELTQVNDNLYLAAYGAQLQLGPGIDIFREFANISHGKFARRDAKEIEGIYNDAKEAPHATKKTVGDALRERAEELNRRLIKANSAERVAVVVDKGNGFDNGSYSFKVYKQGATPGSEDVIGYVKIGNPKNPNQPVEIQTTN